MPTLASAPGIVRPKPLRWHQRLVATAGYGLIEVLAATIRLRGTLNPAVTALPVRQPVIFCVWHNRLAMSLILYRWYSRLHKRPGRMAAIVSASQDGGVLARILEHFGVQPVRGSSSRRGPQALLELTSWAESGYDLAITPDGPRGPCYRVQHGVISLAQLTGLPIIPVTYHLNWKIRLPSWDRFQVPLPLACCRYSLGDPLYIARDLGTEEREAARQRLEEELQRLTRD